MPIQIFLPLYPERAFLSYRPCLQLGLPCIQIIEAGGISVLVVAMAVGEVKGAHVHPS